MSGRVRASLLAVVALSAVLGCGAQPSPSVSPGLPTPSALVPSDEPPTPSPTPTHSAPTTGSPAPMLAIGARGADVVRLQHQLAGLGYWLGPADGVFGETTRQAVYAPQYAARLDVDGVVGARTRNALARNIRPVARSTSGLVVEIDVTKQLLLLVSDGRLQSSLHVSSGGGYLYADRVGYVRASTPRGEFAVTRMVDGWDVSRLGRLWRPAYFSAGYAVHGYADVPPYPASHGCVRVSFAAMNWLWESRRIGVGQQVWVY